MSKLLHETCTSEIASMLYLDSTTRTHVKSGSHVDVGKGFVCECCYIAFNLLSLMFHFTQNIQVRQQWRWACNQIHTSGLPRMIKNHINTRLYQAPSQPCLTTSLPTTDGISHEEPRLFTLVLPWRTSLSLMFHFTQNIQVRQQWRWACNLQQWRWACNLWFCATHNMGGLATPFTNHQQHTNTMSTANHSASKYRTQTQKTWRQTILWSTSNW